MMGNKISSLTWKRSISVIAFRLIALCLFELHTDGVSEEGIHQGIQFEVDPAVGEKIGRIIYCNECSCKEENLLFWSSKEQFPSLGIGHFIWLPEDSKALYNETFPKYLRFLEANETPIPEWLASSRGCPWPTRDAFYAALQENDSKMIDLKKLILSTLSEQTQFIVHQFHAVFDRVYRHLQSQPHAQIALWKMTLSPQGIYALVDYSNFKGSGLSPGEQRNGQGWGLMQVVEKMSLKSDWHEAPEQAFSESAIELLTLRARLSENGKEQEFLPGWVNRCKTYACKLN